MHGIIEIMADNATKRIPSHVVQSYVFMVGREFIVLEEMVKSVILEVFRQAR